MGRNNLIKNEWATRFTRGESHGEELMLGSKAGRRAGGQPQLWCPVHTAVTAGVGREPTEVFW